MSEHFQSNCGLTDELTSRTKLVTIMSGLHNASDFALMCLALSMHFTILMKAICGMRAQRMGIAIFIKVALKVTGCYWSCGSLRKRQFGLCKVGQ